MDSGKVTLVINEAVPPDCDVTESTWRKNLLCVNTSKDGTTEIFFIILSLRD